MKIGTVAMAALMSFGMTASAFAHAHLLTEVPAKGAVVGTAPGALTLNFSEGLQLKFTGIKLHGPNNTVVAIAAAHLAPGNDQQLIVPLPQKLSAGAYTVIWHALSTDGHTTHGMYSFTISP